MRRWVMPKLPALLPILLCLIPTAFAQSPAPAEIDKDLFEVTIPQLESFYTAHKYTVTQVVQWHLARMHKYNGIYRAVETVMEQEALAAAAREDAEPASA